MTYSCIRVQEPLAHKMEMSGFVVQRLLVKCKLVISWCNGQKGREQGTLLHPKPFCSIFYYVCWLCYSHHKDINLSSSSSDKPEKLMSDKCCFLVRLAKPQSVDSNLCFIECPVNNSLSNSVVCSCRYCCSHVLTGRGYFGIRK